MQRRSDGFYSSFDLNGAMAGFAPLVRLVHDFPVELNSRLFVKDRIGDHALHYFHTGDGTYELHGTAYAVQPGALFLVRPGDGYRFRLQPGAPVRMLNIHFDLEVRPEALVPYPCADDAGSGKRILPESYPAYRLLRPRRRYEELFFALLAADGDGLAALLLRNARFLELLAYLDTAGGGDNETFEPVRRAIALLRRDPAAPWPPEELAQRAGVSRSVLFERFRRFTGLTPGEFLRRERLERARYLLLFTRQALKEIAPGSGFADIHHFTRCFREAYGLPPGEFRRRHSGLADKTTTP